MEQKPIEFRVPVAIPTEPWAWQSASLAEKASSLAESNSARERQRASQRSVFRPSAHVRGSYHVYINCFLLFISPSCLTRLIGFYPIFSLFYSSLRVAAARHRVAASHAARPRRVLIIFFSFFFYFFFQKIGATPSHFHCPTRTILFPFFLSFTPPNTAPRA